MKKKPEPKTPSRPARDQVELIKAVPGTCPLRLNAKGKPGPCESTCELFSTDAPQDVTRSEMMHDGIEYTGMCSLRLAAEALAGMSRKNNSLAGF